jgi:hypothetical protein
MKDRIKSLQSSTGIVFGLKSIKAKYFLSLDSQVVTNIIQAGNLSRSDRL